jgi:hypothetical protein
MVHEVELFHHLPEETDIGGLGEGHRFPVVVDAAAWIDMLDVVRLKPKCAETEHVLEKGPRIAGTAQWVGSDRTRDHHALRHQIERPVSILLRGHRAPSGAQSVGMIMHTAESGGVSRLPRIVGSLFAPDGARRARKGFAAQASGVR